MNTQELKCFLKVADRLNFTRAAQELYLTTPTVTHHIQRLEKELGVVLFLRDSKSVRLTMAGEIFYREAQDILLRLETLSARLEEARLREQKLLRLGCTSHQEILRTVAALNAFRQDAPTIRPQFICDDYYTLMRMLSEHQLDAVLGTREMMHGFKDCHFWQLFTCYRMAIFRQDIFTHQGETISLQELTHFPLLVLQQKNIPLQSVNNIEQLLGMQTEVKNYLRQSTVESILTLATSGYGIGILPDCVFVQSKLSSNMRVCRIDNITGIAYGMIVSAKNKNPMAELFFQKMQRADEYCNES